MKFINFSQKNYIIMVTSEFIALINNTPFLVIIYNCDINNLHKGYKEL